MTANAAPPPRATRIPWYARPRVTLGAVAGLLIASALLSPERLGGRNGDARLSSYSPGPLGARILFTLAQRLGWRTERMTTAALSADSTTIVALLAPTVPLRHRDAHALLEHVRAGGALFVVLSDGTTALADSLHIDRGSVAFYLPPTGTDASRCDSLPPPLLSTFSPAGMQVPALRWRRPPPSAVEYAVPVSILSGRGGGESPAIVGFAYGRGRIVVVSSPSFLRNDAVRICKLGVDIAAVRALEYLKGGTATPRDRLLFDEYHQGYGSQPGTLLAITAYLAGVPSGRVLLQLLACGLLLLLAAMPRIIAPRDAPRIERRSPLEHIDALARAYAQVGATRTATQRLVRGLRRRLARGAVGERASLTDDQFLQRARDAAPAIGESVALVQRALAAPLSPRDFAAVGVALGTIETALKRT